MVGVKVLLLLASLGIAFSGIAAMSEARRWPSPSEQRLYWLVSAATSFAAAAVLAGVASALEG